jgi:hypothetical protein
LARIKEMSKYTSSMAATKEIRTAEDLSAQVLAALKARRFSGGTNRMVVLPWDGNPAIANRTINNFDSGRSLAIDVEMALLEIVPPLQLRYDLIG